MRKTRIKTADRELADTLGLDVEHMSDVEIAARLKEGLGEAGGSAPDANDNDERANDNEPRLGAEAEAASIQETEPEADAASGTDAQAGDSQGEEARSRDSGSADQGYDYGEELDRAAAGGRGRIAASPFVSAKWKIIRPREWLYGDHYIRG
jgi:hypothetical protein